MDERLAKQYEQIEKSFRKIVQYSNRTFDHFELSKSQFLLLRSLLSRQRAKVSDLAHDLGLTLSSTTMTLNRLEDLNYIRRIRDEADRRVVWVELTEATAQRLADLVERRNALVMEVLNELEPEEVDTLTHLFQKIASKLE